MWFTGPGQAYRNATLAPRHPPRLVSFRNVEQMGLGPWYRRPTRRTRIYRRRCCVCDFRRMAWPSLPDRVVEESWTTAERDAVRALSHIKRTVLRAKYRLRGKRVVHYLHIGKTGGSAVKFALKDHTINRRFAVYLHSHGFKLPDVPKGDGVIFFLRDPVNRFVSGFNSRRRQGQPRVFLPWSPDEKVAFETFGTPNQLGRALSSDDAGRRKAAERAMRSIGHVRTSYWDWLIDEEYLRSRMSDILLIGFQERLAEDFEHLKVALQIPEVVRLPQDDVRAHRNPETLDTRLDDGVVAKLKQWYRRDYELIDFCRELFPPDTEFISGSFREFR